MSWLLSQRAHPQVPVPDRCQNKWRGPPGLCFASRSWSTGPGNLQLRLRPVKAAAARQRPTAREIRLRHRLGACATDLARCCLSLPCLAERPLAQAPPRHEPLPPTAPTAPSRSRLYSSWPACTGVRRITPARDVVDPAHPHHVVRVERLALETRVLLQSLPRRWLNSDHERGHRSWTRRCPGTIGTGLHLHPKPDRPRMLPGQGGGPACIRPTRARRQKAYE